jgi:ribosomal-protein-alanine N-acetyltransferase
MNLLIRRMISADLDQVIAIDQASFSLPWPARSFQFELSDNPASRSWVAEVEGQVVGMIILWLIVDEAHVATLATHAQFRRQGIGGRLLQHALSSVRAEGAQRAFLEVRAGNWSAQEMYRSFGFVEDGRRPRYYKDNNEDAILMSLKELPEER